MRWWALSALWAGLIFWLSSSSDAQGGFELLELLPYGDKLAHGAAYGVLGGFLYRACNRAALAIGFTGLYGLSDEVHQAFVPGRSADALDLAADLLGAALGVAAVRYVTRRAPRRANPVE